MAYRKDPNDLDRKAMFDKHKSNIKIMNWVTGITIILNSATFVALTVCVFTNKEHKLIDEENLSFRVWTATCFAIIAVAFLTIGLLLMRRLYVYFPEFYHENKCLLYLATIGLCLPLLLRAVYDYLYLNESVKCFFIKNELASNTFVWVFLDFMPISFQLSSMIFGYIRNKNDKKLRKTMQQDR